MSLYTKSGSLVMSGGSVVTDGGGSITHLQSITVTGSGFGTKSRGIAPLAYDTGTAAVGTVDAVWNPGNSSTGTGYQPTTAGGIYDFQMQAAGFSPTGAALGTPDPFITQFYAGCHKNLNTSTGGNAVSFDITLAQPAFPFGVWFKYKYRLDPNWVPDPLSDENLKIFSYDQHANWGITNNWYSVFQDIVNWPISTITQANPCSVHIYVLGMGTNPASIGDTVMFEQVGGMTQINGLTGTVTAIGGSDPVWTASVNIDTTAFSPFSVHTVTNVARGGTGDAGAPALGYTTITVSTGGVSNPFTAGGSNWLNLQSIGGTTQLNSIGAGVNNAGVPSNTGFITAIGGVSGAWTATIDVNSSTYGAYTVGGTATTGRYATPRLSNTSQFNIGGLNGYAQGIWQGPNDANGHSSSYWNSAPWPYDPANGWIAMEHELSATTTAGLPGQGFYKEYHNRSLVVNYAGKTDGGIASGARNIMTGIYSRDRNVNNFRYYGGPIVVDQNAGGSPYVARLMAGDAATLATCTFLEYVYPTAWSDTSVTGTFWQGQFTSGQTAYFYVYNESGTVQLAGQRTVA